MLVEGAIADWSAIYLRTSVLTGPGLAALGYAVFSGAMAGGRLTGDYLTGKLGRGHLVCYGALLAAAGLVFVLLSGNAGSAEGTPKLTVYREALRASYLDLPVKTHDP